jgi:hypothetical protein
LICLKTLQFERHYLDLKSRANRDAIMSGFLRALTFLSIAALVAPAPSASAGADVPAAAKAPPAYQTGPGTPPAAKGTRNQQALPGTSPSAPTPHPRSADPASTSGDALGQCMAVWDADTHMTKDEWRDACRRVIKERVRQPGT